jgi:hypothetical protein
MIDFQRDLNSSHHGDEPGSIFDSLCVCITMCYMNVEVRRLVWDAWNVPHIARHDVTPDEVEAACHAQPVFYKQSYRGRMTSLA